MDFDFGLPLPGPWVQIFCFREVNPFFLDRVVLFGLLLLVLLLLLLLLLLLPLLLIVTPCYHPPIITIATSALDKARLPALALAHSVLRVLRQDGDPAPFCRRHGEA